MNDKALAQTGALLAPREEIGREIALRDKGDEAYRFQLRKLANLHLGVRVKTQAGKEYPKATEYFVLPDSLRNDPSFRAKLESLGEDPDKPTKLPVMLLSNDFATSMVTSCDLYGQSGKLKCRSLDGKHCTRLNEQTFEYEDKECPAEPCKDCDWYHRFRFLLPDAPGIGYYQVVTKSDNNHGALLREIRDLRNLKRGGIAGIDLKLILTNEREFHVAVADRSGKKSMITTSPYLLHLEGYTNLRDILKAEQIGEVYDAEIIEQDMDAEDMPIVESEEEFTSGLPEQTEPIDAEVIPETGEVVQGPITAEQESMLKAMAMARFTNAETQQFDSTAYNLFAIGMVGVGPGHKPYTFKQLNQLQAQILIDRLMDLSAAAMVAAEGEQVDDPFDN
jgi:hypothetical protein